MKAKALGVAWRKHSQYCPMHNRYQSDFVGGKVPEKVAASVLASFRQPEANTFMEHEVRTWYNHFLIGN